MQARITAAQGGMAGDDLQFREGAAGSHRHPSRLELLLGEGQWPILGKSRGLVNGLKHSQPLLRSEVEEQSPTSDFSLGTAPTATLKLNRKSHLKSSWQQSWLQNLPQAGGRLLPWPRDPARPVPWHKQQPQCHAACHGQGVRSSPAAEDAQSPDPCPASVRFCITKQPR